MDGKKLQCQYKDYLSDFKSWKQKSHAKQWLIFAENIGTPLSIDETALSKGELYTIITNKKSKGKGWQYCRHICRNKGRIYYRTAS